jgi:hypothetical protein
MLVVVSWSGAENYRMTWLQERLENSGNGGLVFRYRR